MGQTPQKTILQKQEIALWRGNTEEWQACGKCSIAVENDVIDDTYSCQVCACADSQGCCGDDGVRLTEEVLIVHHDALRHVDLLENQDEISDSELPTLPDCVIAARKRDHQRFVKEMMTSPRTIALPPETWLARISVVNAGPDSPLAPNASMRQPIRSRGCGKMPQFADDLSDTSPGWRLAPSPTRIGRPTVNPGIPKIPHFLPDGPAPPMSPPPVKRVVSDDECEDEPGDFDVDGIDAFSDESTL